MTVAELRQKLEKCDPEALITFEDDGGTYDVALFAGEDLIVEQECYDMKHEQAGLFTTDPQASPATPQSEP
jgi:hypothetical protein